MDARSLTSITVRTDPCDDAASVGRRCRGVETCLTEIGGEIRDDRALARLAHRRGAATFGANGLRNRMLDVFRVDMISVCGCATW